jgi:transcriptional regulator with XRE-family HTH domain
MLEALGERLRQERVRLEMNQVEFGGLAGASRNSQGQYETGKTPPTTEYLLKLQEHGVDIGFVLTGKRESGALGYLEQHLLGLFRSIEPYQREAMLNFLGAMARRPQVDLSSSIGDDPVHSTLHAPARPYRGPKRPTET